MLTLEEKRAAYNMGIKHAKELYEPKEAIWKKDSSNSKYLICSACGAPIEDNRNIELFRFCPLCGAHIHMTTKKPPATGDDVSRRHMITQDDCTTDGGTMKRANREKRRSYNKGVNVTPDSLFESVAVEEPKWMTKNNARRGSRKMDADVQVVITVHEASGKNKSRVDLRFYNKAFKITSQRKYALLSEIETNSTRIYFLLADEDSEDLDYKKIGLYSKSCSNIRFSRPEGKESIYDEWAGRYTEFHFEPQFGAYYIEKKDKK